MAEERENKMRDFLLKASKNHDLREEFLKDPKAVGEKYGFEITKENLEKIKRTSMFIDSLNDIRLPPGPIYYPIDTVLSRWKVSELTHVLTYLRVGPIWYPADFRVAGLGEVEQVAAKTRSR
jgi:hypothetical protein